MDGFKVVGHAITAFSDDPITFTGFATDEDAVDWASKNLDKGAWYYSQLAEREATRASD